MSDENTCKRLVKQFIENDVVAASKIIEGLEDSEAADLLASLPSDLAARVIKNLQVTFAAGLLEKTEDTFLQQLLPKLDPQLLTTILMLISAQSRERLKIHISGAVEKQIIDLLEYPEGSVGRIVTTDFLSFDKSVTAKDAISRIRSLSRKSRPASYAYVVDDQKHLLGVGRDEKPFSTIFFSLKKRLFWLHINLVTAFMAAAVVALFKDIIAKLTILAVFLPVVAGQGGNAGAQSLAVVMRGIIMREIPKDKARALILKEGGLGAINGLIIGIVTHTMVDEERHPGIFQKNY